jgi:hypothetical protein
MPAARVVRCSGLRGGGQQRQLHQPPGRPHPGRRRDARLQAAGQLRVRRRSACSPSVGAMKRHSRAASIACSCAAAPPPQWASPSRCAVHRHPSLADVTAPGCCSIIRLADANFPSDLARATMAAVRVNPNQGQVRALLRWRRICCRLHDRCFPRVMHRGQFTRAPCERVSPMQHHSGMQTDRTCSCPPVVLLMQTCSCRLWLVILRSHFLRLRTAGCLLRRGQPRVHPQVPGPDADDCSGAHLAGSPRAVCCTYSWHAQQHSIASSAEDRLPAKEVPQHCRCGAATQPRTYMAPLPFWQVVEPPSAVKALSPGLLRSQALAKLQADPTLGGCFPAGATAVRFPPAGGAPTTVPLAQLRPGDVVQVIYFAL